MEYDPTEKCDFFQIELENDQNVPVNVLSNERNYYSEVNCIMHAFGDVKEPLRSSVKLMHQLLQSQMALLIRNAEDVMLLRKGKNIAHSDVLFLMRKNKVLLKRLLKYLFVEDAKSCFLPNIKKFGGEFKVENGRRVSQCLKYFAFIEKFTGDLTSVLRDESIVDHVYMKRLKRRDLMAESMTKEEYESFFTYTLRMTFCHKHTYARFKSWLQQCSCTTSDITPLALSICHFLARETIAGIVDKALEIKSRKYENNNFELQDLCNPDDQFCESEQDLDDSETNLLPSLSEASKNNSKNENYILEDPSTSAKLENEVAESNTVILNSPNDIHEKDVAPKSSHLDQNSSSKICAKNKSVVRTSKRKISKSFSVSNKKLNSNAGKSKTIHDMCDNTKLDNKFPSTNYANENESAIMRIDQVIDDVIRQYCDTSEETNKDPHFPLNFKEKTFSINAKLENEVAESNTVILNSPNDIQEKDVAPKSSHLDQNSSSKICAKNKSVRTSKRKISKSFSVSNKNLNGNAGKSKTNHDMCDNSKLDNKFPSTNYFNVNASSIMRIDQVIDDVIHQYCDTSEETNQDPHFSLDFKEKTLSICYNGSKTFEISTSSTPQADRCNETAARKAASFIMECIDESKLDCFKTEDFDSILLKGFNKHIGHFPFAASIKVDSKLHWFPNEAITPEEIQAAFICYQNPLPMSYLMKTKLFDLPPRNTNLVCLAIPDDFM